MSDFATFLLYRLVGYSVLTVYFFGHCPNFLAQCPKNFKPIRTRCPKNFA